MKTPTVNTLGTKLFVEVIDDEIVLRTATSFTITDAMPVLRAAGILPKHVTRMTGSGELIVHQAGEWPALQVLDSSVSLSTKLYGAPPDESPAPLLKHVGGNAHVKGRYLFEQLEEIEGMLMASEEASLPAVTLVHGGLEPQGCMLRQLVGVGGAVYGNPSAVRGLDRLRFVGGAINADARTVLTKCRTMMGQRDAIAAARHWLKHEAIVSSISGSMLSQCPNEEDDHQEPRGLSL